MAVVLLPGLLFRLVGWLLVLVARPSLAMGLLPTNRSVRSQTATAHGKFAMAPPNHQEPPPAGSEVVGASGRMGTFYYERAAAAWMATKKEGGSCGFVAACPRGTTPGSSTREGCPIYVATPSDAYHEIYEATPVGRRNDLVLAGNAGLPIDDRFSECTILVPHFSVLYEHQWKGGGKDDNDSHSDSDSNSGTMPPRIRVDTDPEVSPPTYVYGTHASTVAALLQANGIATEIVPTFSEIKAYAGRKLLWASCFWLLCHDDSINGESMGDLFRPLTVGKVHEVRPKDLERLVDEILPSLRDWLVFAGEENDKGGGDDIATSAATSATTSSSAAAAATTNLEPILDRDAILAYLEAYSKSISSAVPSVDLALREFADRNAVWLSHPCQGRGTSSPHPQSFHTSLLQKQGVDVGALTSLEEDGR